MTARPVWFGDGVISRRTARCQVAAENTGDNPAAVRQEQQRVNCGTAGQENAQAEIEQSRPHADGRAVPERVLRVPHRPTEQEAGLQ